MNIRPQPSGLSRRTLAAGLAAIPVLAGSDFVPPVKAQIGALAPSLQSWNEGEAKRAILEFIARVTTARSAYFVEPGARVAVFDNDGTLWPEQPMYVQLA